MLDMMMCFIHWNQSKAVFMDIYLGVAENFHCIEGVAVEKSLRTTALDSEVSYETHGIANPRMSKFFTYACKVWLG